ncbi:WSC domain-containing protein 1-like [Penaeus chinensis]|uniref:WSC domain-containing protein 1-like n=1 Tax=Penaeus chinensis TaxID=139456 RepID=UPI001FB848FA|nr:WSC domain-containing protein 1-like [Penaeus chinensis]XP_047488880.1 WSC domain-containing protein 1-like [Penaeus chinensis]XP_047488881.1 WSC domain-containing protein 1-like [Penaeus chinensis]
MEVKWDETAPSWQLWKDDNTSVSCRNYKTRFAKGLPRTYLVSFPGSGNTWIRYLLEAASGVFTGSVYTDAEIRNAGYLGEGDRADSGRTLVQKTHGGALTKAHNDLVSRYNFIKADVPVVLIIRDPARALLSYWKFLHGRGKGSHTNQVSEKTYRTAEFRRHVERMVPRWEELVSDRLLWQKAPIYVLYYDLVVKNPVHHVREVLKFLRVPVDEGRLACLGSHLSGTFKRPEKKELDPFTYSEKKLMSLAVMRISRLLRLRGFPVPPPYPSIANISDNYPH